MSYVNDDVTNLRQHNINRKTQGGKEVEKNGQKTICVCIQIARNKTIFKLSRNAKTASDGEAQSLTLIGTPCKV